MLQYQDKTADELLSDSEWQVIAREFQLSARELQILQHVVVDEKEFTIADRLRISPHTVHTHLNRLYRKLGVCSRMDAVVMVFREYVLWAHQGRLCLSCPRAASANRPAA
jgi:DNA-binding CsgD family transcriptional regulator